MDKEISIVSWQRLPKLVALRTVPWYDLLFYKEVAHNSSCYAWNLAKTCNVQLCTCVYKSNNILFSYDLILVDEEPVLVELPYNLLRKVGSANLLVEMTLPPLVHPLDKSIGSLLKSVVRNSVKAQMVDDMSVHHVMAHPIDPLAIVAIDSLEGSALKSVRVIRVQLSVVGVMLQVRHHEEPEA